MLYLNRDTGDKVATKLLILVVALEDRITKQEMSSTWIWPQIQLLSPDSIYSSRPLMNGYKATTIETSLELLSKWMKECDKCHDATCRLSDGQVPTLKHIHVIDIREKDIVERDPSNTRYAALSYVWGQSRSAMRDQMAIRQQANDEVPGLFLDMAPKVIKDAVHVCNILNIPYLWIDFYCIPYGDPTRQSLEIDAMGEIYRYSNITFIAGSPLSSHSNEATQDSDSGLLPTDFARDLGAEQRIETIKNHRYISTLRSALQQFADSNWTRRGWTMQEGQLARRIAFFGQHDILFMCGAGCSREALHHGEHGHGLIFPELDLHCLGTNVLAALGWLNSPTWNFADYSTIQEMYRGRQLSFESDRLRAISGCLNIISRRKGIRGFLHGLPSRDFHFALLWSGEYDRPSGRFPSWSWAEWHTPSHTRAPHYLISPIPEQHSFSNIIDESEEAEHGNQGRFESDLSGLIFNVPDRVRFKYRCAQNFAHIQPLKQEMVIAITSEMAYFFVDIVPDQFVGGEHEGYKKIPSAFDSWTSAPVEWDLNAEYPTPLHRLYLRDSSEKSYHGWHRRWYDGLIIPMLNFPLTLRGSTLTWLLSRGIWLIKIIEVESLEGDDDTPPFHRVFCLGIDSSDSVPSSGTRMGMFCLPKEVWDRAGPREGKVELR
ncbi:MAG: hypothetical protein Q9227_004546 [Pyrenula ochraceoflavens]